MAEQKRDHKDINKLYSYTANANLVLQADRSQLARRENEPTGEPETLWGRLDVKQMGDRSIRSKPTEELQKMKQKQQQQHEHGVINTTANGGKKKKRSEGITSGYGFSSVLDAVDDFEGLAYRPRTKETREAYSLILHFVHLVIGDKSQELLRGATDEILALLKDDQIKDFDRKKSIEEILGEKLESEKFAQLVNLGKKITDYEGATEDQQAMDETGANGGELDQDVGVAVVFDEDEEDEDAEDNLYEVRDDGDNDEDLDEGEEKVCWRAVCLD